MRYSVAICCAALLTTALTAVQQSLDASVLTEFRREQVTGLMPGSLQSLKPKTVRDLDNVGKSEFYNKTFAQRWWSSTLREGWFIWMPAVLLGCLYIAVRAPNRNPLPNVIALSVVSKPQAS